MNRLEYLKNTPVCRLGEVTFNDDTYQELEYIVEYNGKTYNGSRVVFNKKMNMLGLKINIFDLNADYKNISNLYGMSEMLSYWLEAHER